MKPPSLSFQALPGCPHLTHTWCGYMLLSLAGLNEEVTPEDVALIQVNAINQNWKALGDSIMVWPSIGPKFEAQRLKIILQTSAVTQGLKTIKAVQATHVPPDLSMGLGRPQSAYERGI